MSFMAHKAVLLRLQDSKVAVAFGRAQYTLLLMLSLMMIPTIDDHSLRQTCELTVFDRRANCDHI